jgi:hypothetical protein
VITNCNETRMLEFVQTTIANMTALVIVCKKIPSEKDSREIRERIAEAMIAYARSGKRTLGDFENTGPEILR